MSESEDALQRLQSDPQYGWREGTVHSGVILTSCGTRNGAEDVHVSVLCCVSAFLLYYVRWATF